MALAALELNDQSLLIQAEDGPMYAEPGFARLTPAGIETGEEAHTVAWREPQNSYNQFWCHLNQTPLAARQKWARHHGDIAFAQLRNLWQGAGSPESLIVLVPGSFSDEQLSLLLGMIGALPASVQVIMDSALAACLDVHRDTLYVDMQLHQSVLSLVRVQGGSLSVAEQEIFPALGSMQIHNSVARHISHLLIDSSRYDPLHASDSEQDIYDRIPGWLTGLCWENEISATVNSAQGELPFILRREAVKDLVRERLVNARSFLARHPGVDLLLSHHAGLLAGLSDEFAAAEVAGQSACTDHCLAHHPELFAQIEDLYRVRDLERGESAAQYPAGNEQLATHVLYQDQALPLRRPVSISLANGGLQLVNRVDEEAALTVVLKNRSLEMVHKASGLETTLPSSCQPGEFIVVNGHQLRLIEVQDG